MNYNLSTITHEEKGWSSLRKLLPLLANEKFNLIIASVAIILTSGLNLLAPFLVGYTIDHYVVPGNFRGVLMFGGLILVVYLVALVAQYIQTVRMGMVGQDVLYSLRNKVFTKLSDLPVAFFNQNKAGDLISRVNNDTDKLNQFFSRGLMQFIGSIFLIIGSGIFVVSLDWKLGLVALAPAALLFIFTRLVSPLVRRLNAVNLATFGSMNAEIQESLDNFKVIVAFNRRDYFRDRFETANSNNYKTALKSGIVSSVMFNPVYTFASALAQLAVLLYGIYLISVGDMTIGLLISFFAYLSRFYDPLRQIAVVWAEFQTALAGWDRISDILSMNSDYVTLPKEEAARTNSVLEFNDVSFGYVPEQEVLHHVSFSLEQGKTYALVGPTGGGKTTTASLMARLYDPTKGQVLLDGRDIRSYEGNERTQRIGFILQEPFLFQGTLYDNIVYGNDEYAHTSKEALVSVLEESNLTHLLERFPSGLDTQISGRADSLSLGQKQLVAFMRAVLRKPDILILDEATANIDTVTEQLLEDVLQKLPAHTTRVIIAHRLNTIANADEIFFVNNGEVVQAGSMQNAVEMLLHGKQRS
jgi:ATP-binding cassette subfamily B protein